MPKAPRHLRRAVYKADDVADDTWVIMIDMSDTTNYNFPSDTGSVTILGMDLTTEKASDGRYDLHVGVVTENDGTDGTLQIIKTWFLQADGNATESTDRFVDQVSFVYPRVRLEKQGVDCNVTGDATEFLVGTQLTEQTGLESDATGLASARGGTSLAAAAGDIMLLIDEGTSGGTISICLGIDYYVN